MPNTENLMIKISPELKAQIKQEAKKKEVSMSHFVRSVVKERLARKPSEKQGIVW